MDFFSRLPRKSPRWGIGLGAIMKKVVLASMALAALLATPARAAEVAVKAPVYQAAPVLPYNWSGAYLGINVGGGWSRNPIVLDNPAVNLDFLEGGGAIAGGYIGYNYQLSPWFLVGLEGAGAWAQIKQVGQDCTIDVPASCTSNIKSLASVRGRAGIVLERVLVYGAGGWGFADARYDRVFLPPGSPLLSGASSSLSGVTGAAGVEAAITDVLIGRVQYEYFDFGNTTYAAGVLSDIANVTVRTRVHTLTVGFAAKFGGPGY
jgi:outer membrane immunogenic protein